MAARGTKTAATLAFLTVLEDSQHGACGGLLLLNAAGRPLEFHCTTPLKPNRAQEILYGPTLRPYLYGERIGATLVAQAAAPIDVLCVDLSEALAVRPHVQPPTVLVAPPAAADDAGQPPTLRIDPAHAHAAPLHWFEANGHRLGVHDAFTGDREIVASCLAPLADFDLGEPFARIREAIEEARRGSR